MGEAGRDPVREMGVTGMAQPLVFTKKRKTGCEKDTKNDHN